MLVLALLLAPLLSPNDAGAAPSPVEVRVTHRHLEPLCIDGARVAAGVRQWMLVPGAHSMVFTMRNEPRSGIATAEPGRAAVEFDLVGGHRYEIEVRGHATAESLRVWKQAEWKPVVRDRSADKLVSDPPAWDAPVCP